MNLSKEIYVRGEAGWVVIAIDLAIGPSVRLTKNFDAFLRFHQIGGVDLKSGEFYWALPLFIIDPGARLRVRRRIWIEGGIWGLMIPYVGLVLY